MSDKANNQKRKEPIQIKEETPAIQRFGAALRQRNSCPLCNFVRSEVEKGNPLPMEEWIFVNHLNAAHKLEP